MTEQQKQIAKEMIPFLIHIIWPVTLILLIAKVYAPNP